jgi:hypothetical protein
MCELLIKRRSWTGEMRPAQSHIHIPYTLTASLFLKDRNISSQNKHCKIEAHFVDRNNRKQRCLQQLFESKTTWLPSEDKEQSQALLSNKGY